MKKKFTILCFFSVFLTVAQTEKQREVIKAAMNKEQIALSQQQLLEYDTARKTRVATYLIQNPDKKESFEENGKPKLLYDVQTDGSPIYITTKDLGQVNDTKASNLQTGGSVFISSGLSLNLNLTGQVMTVGVWDGGQVNASHEALAGQATMQASQPLTSAAGNDHMQACTAMMVGKNINNKRGIAFGANAFCYDWDNDITEMQAFSASGFLISNHSYGYANDNTTPQWTFGAYDSQSRAWDIMLKAKPNYLPFVAAGNEQMSNGNSAANGFDLITGASASKNAITIGATNGAAVMSNYSNWGPTDDGRVKPDIVTKGTDIEYPVFTNNTGYTQGSGTSYATPAAAAGALLLQQYYASLTESYMTASMLKALLLHTADDAGNVGPDAKFGWGVLNLEKAAEVIYRATHPNNTSGQSGAIMRNFTTNPGTVSNPNSELSISGITFLGGTKPAKASICWQDDEGSEQDAADGINYNTTSLIYDFDMMLRQFTPFADTRTYKNLSISNPNNVATRSTTWFDGNGNNYKQVYFDTPTANAAGILYFRKKSTSPTTVKPYSVIITGLTEPLLSADDFDIKETGLIFYDKKDQKIKLISNNFNIITNYQIFSIDGKLLQSDIANANEINFTNSNTGIYIIKYNINGKLFSTKFLN